MITGARGYSFEKKYANPEEGLGLVRLWELYDMFYSTDSRLGDEAIRQLKALPYKEDNEEFDAFKKDADATQGTLGFKAAQLKKLAARKDELEASKKKLEQDKDALVSDHVQSITYQLEQTKISSSGSSATNGNGHAPTDTNGKKAKKSGSCTLL
jgi:hypothetical protein